MRLLAYFIILISASFMGCQEDKVSSKKEKLKITALSKEEIKQEITQIDEELQSIGSVSQLEKYIQNVITNGSTGLGYPGGDMEGGFASIQDTQDIARYVVTLSGQKSSDNAKANKAAIFYTSNCGGCHGNDGKGLGGSFPNLTQLPYKGIIRLKETLQHKKRDLKSKLN